MDAKEWNAFFPEELRLSRRTVRCSAGLKIKAARCVPRKDAWTPKGNFTTCRQKWATFFLFAVRDCFMFWCTDCLKETVYFQTLTLVKCSRRQQRATKPFDRLHFWMKRRPPQRLQMAAACSHSLGPGRILINCCSYGETSEAHPHGLCSASGERWLRWIKTGQENRSETTWSAPRTLLSVADHAGWVLKGKKT